MFFSCSDVLLWKCDEKLPKHVLVTLLNHAVRSELYPLFQVLNFHFSGDLLFVSQ